MAQKTVRCPHCGQTFSVPETVPVAVCPYCGTAIWLGTGEVFREHFMYPVRHEYNSAYKLAIGVASRQYEAPERLEIDASPTAGLLHFVPLYLYRVRVRAECPGNPEAGLEESWENRLATSSPPKGLPESYVFPSRGRRFFEPKILERGKYYQPDIDPKSLISEVSSKASIKALREAFNWCEKPKIVNETVWQGIVHYPFWEIRYSYMGEEYYALVDAAGGRVVYLEYPIGSTKRATLVMAAAGIMGISALLGALVGSSLDAPLAGLAGGVIGSVPGSAVYLRSGVKRRGIYRLVG